MSNKNKTLEDIEKILKKCDKNNKKIITFMYWSKESLEAFDKAIREEFNKKYKHD